jgi:hypothetical protein
MNAEADRVGNHSLFTASNPLIPFADFMMFSTCSADYAIGGSA